jgi:hypothetical protein
VATDKELEKIALDKHIKPKFFKQAAFNTKKPIKVHLMATNTRIFFTYLCTDLVAENRS